MTDHPTITPPPELVQQWASESLATQNLCNRAAQWGADQELEACIDWISVYQGLEHPELLIELLRAARRPKPPSLKKQALKAAHIELDPDGKNGALIIRALEALPDD